MYNKLQIQPIYLLPAAFDYSNNTVSEFHVIFMEFNPSLNCLLLIGALSNMAVLHAWACPLANHNYVDEPCFLRLAQGTGWSDQVIWWRQRTHLRGLLGETPFWASYFPLWQRISIKSWRVPRNISPIAKQEIFIDCTWVHPYVYGL